jgi:hypothetical protein
LYEERRPPAKGSGHRLARHRLERAQCVAASARDIGELRPCARVGAGSVGEPKLQSGTLAKSKTCCLAYFVLCSQKAVRAVPRCDESCSAYRIVSVAVARKKGNRHRRAARWSVHGPCPTVCLALTLLGCSGSSVPNVR